MEKIEIMYEENGKFESLIIYGRKNYNTFMDENKKYINVISIKELWKRK